MKSLFEVLPFIAIMTFCASITWCQGYELGRKRPIPAWITCECKCHEPKQR